ncbi:TadA family conjugal transfer-associated ATPase [Cellulomonas sp. PhB143]|uniref:TadA family conjugal transfer-associated ATPase n=1 Tax=Cellulomonas sp. PhB143 TaxID=2485186 RepID=UPI000FB8AFBB|nr:TadA family conjugal transfer-associated ATPase [Cellulomonas sp. PhB143]ROS76574.1 pilus assembly protein CpaF [Cellulomonas sp. PhB143]
MRGRVEPRPAAGDGLVGDVRRRIASGDAQDVGDALRTSGRLLGSETVDALGRRARAELFGAGPLQRLVETDGVTDVLVNGPQDVWIDRGDGVERVAVGFPGPEAVRALAVRLAAAGGQRLDDASPMVDACLPDGTRLHAVLPPVCGEGAVISLRVLRRRASSLEGLVAGGSVPAGWAPLVRGLVSRRANVLVSGGTGSGKTTLLAALLSLVGPDQRVVVVEEARELVPDHPHVVPLTARRANVEGAGEVDLAALVRTALRMRPDRIVLGECRGGEVREVLMAMNTGHDGGFATVHANTAAHVPARLEALGALAGMSREAVAAQTVGAVHVVLHVQRRGSRRWVSQVGQVVRAGPAGLAVEVVGRWDGTAPPEAGPGWAALAERWEQR